MHRSVSQQLRSSTLRDWAALDTATRVSVRHAILESMNLPRVQRSSWLESQALPADCKRIIEKLAMTDDGDETVISWSILGELLAQPSAYPGDQFGDWSVVRPIGYGGLGDVYLARRTKQDFEQYAALKLLRLTSDTNASRRAFMRERNHLARIGRLIDGGISRGGQQFLVTEYSENGNLIEYCDRYQLDIRSRIELFCELCEAIEYIHVRGLIHCDIKPDNILIGGDNQIDIVDLGVAKHIGQDQLHSFQDPNQGYTPGYAAPEQFSCGHLTEMTDVYALGRVLEELLIGEIGVPGSGNQQSLISIRQRFRDHDDKKTIAENRNLSVDEVVEQLTSRVDVILKRAMAPTPAERYGNVTALRRAAYGYMISLPNPDLSDRDLINRFIRKRPVLLGITISTILLIGLFMGLFIARTKF